MFSILLITTAVGIADPNQDAAAALALAKAKRLRDQVAKVETAAPVRLADPTSHIHRCPSCGTEWSHSNSSAGDRAKHTCPTCRNELPRPWMPSERGVRIERRKVAYRDVVERVQAGESLTVAVGTDDEADCVVDRVPDTEPGLWRCFLQDGKPVMERVDVPKTVYQSLPQNFLSVSGSR